MAQEVHLARVFSLVGWRGNTGVHLGHSSAHLVTPRLGYLHHGIYAGNGRVIDYSGFNAIRRSPMQLEPRHALCGIV
ncbi:MAG: hypothetical protein EXR28_15585 [Betaproteobacteria bacterium]|nr:hypothetical protein [Betaproteobacteria bacterium]